MVCITTKSWEFKGLHLLVPMGLPRNATILIGVCVLLIELTLVYIEILHPKMADSCNCSAAPTRSQIQRKLEPAFIQTPTIKKKLGPSFLLIMVPILFSSVQSRDLIRDTWYKGL